MSNVHALAKVTCRDGKVREFVATIEGECLHFEGKKHTYVIFDEPEGRGFVTMVPAWDRDSERIYALAPLKWQPEKIVATTSAGTWTWELNDE